VIFEDLADYVNCENIAVEPEIYFDDPEPLHHTEYERIENLIKFWALDRIDRVIIFARLQNIHTTESELANLCGITRQAISKRVKYLANNSNCFKHILYYKPRAHERITVDEPKYNWKKEVEK